jgi:hypothetical protein
MQSQQVRARLMMMDGVAGGGQAVGPLAAVAAAPHHQQAQQALTFYQNTPMLGGALRGGQHSQQASPQERRDRARLLLDRICRLRKPQMYENMNAMTDSKRIFQTLLNTENIENKTNPSQIVFDEADGQKMQVDQMHLKEKKDRQNAKKAESNTEPVPDADSDSLEPHKLGGDGPNSSLSA